MDVSQSHCASQLAEASQQPWGDDQINHGPTTHAYSMPVDTRNIQNLTNTASTPAMWSFNDFDASPVSTYSLETPSTSSRNGDINPFDSSFARYSSYTGQGISPPMFSPYTTPGSYWSSSPGVASIDLTFSPPQLGMTPCRTTPSSFGYSSVGNNFIPANYFPVAESLDITIVPPRKRVTPVKKPSKSAIDPAMIKKRSTIRRKQNSNRASETFQKIASTSLHAEEGKVTPAPTEGEDLKSHEVDKAKHKDVEMKYRMQMRDRYAELLLTLPEGGGRAEQILGSDEKTPTRGKILDFAVMRIDELKNQRRELESQRHALQQRIAMYEASLIMRQGLQNGE